MVRVTVRAAMYARVSTDKQAQTGTIASQLEALRQRLDHDGVTYDEALCFTDDGVSGELLDRPALDRLRDQVALGGIDRIYVHSPDRLARKYAYQVLLLDEFRRAGVAVEFLNHAADATPEGELLLQVQGMIAEYERAKILERSRRGKRQAARSGDLSVFSNAPFGYRYVSKSEGAGVARYDVVPDQARTVANIFDWYVRDRMSIRAICLKLTAAGIKTPGGRDQWRSSILWSLLQNPAYRGRACYGRRKAGGRRSQEKALWKPFTPTRTRSLYWTDPHDRIEVPVPALISEALFAAAQEQLTENRRRCRAGPRGPRFLLQGLAVCQHCGHALIHFMSGGLRSRKSGGPYFYYRCTGLDSHHWGGKRICSSRAVRADRLERVVWADVCDLLAQPDRLQHEYQRRLEELMGEPSRATGPVQQLHGRVQRSITRLIDAYQDGLLEKAEFEPRLRQAKERLSALERELASAQERDEARREAETVISQFREFAEAVTTRLDDADLSLKIRIVRALIQRIEVDKTDVKIVYRVGHRPFDLGPETGTLQDSSRSVLYALWQKRLAKGAFEFPKVIGSAAGVEVSATDLALILGGVALNAKRRMRYTLAASTAAAN
jgi:site-specific DNA recombinase